MSCWQGCVPVTMIRPEKQNLNGVRIYERPHFPLRKVPMANWLITGVSSGFGLELARAALARGDTVVGTLRQPAQAASFEQIAPGRSHAVVLDVTQAEAVGAAVHQALLRAGRIDVLVNNAGYGLFGAVEETSDAEARQVM